MSESFAGLLPKMDSTICPDRVASTDNSVSLSCTNHHRQHSSTFHHAKHRESFIASTYPMSPFTAALQPDARALRYGALLKHDLVVSSHRQSPLALRRVHRPS